MHFKLLLLLCFLKPLAARIEPGGTFSSVSGTFLLLSWIWVPHFFRQSDEDEERRNEEREYILGERGSRL